MEDNKKYDKIGELLVRYEGNFGTLALDMYIPIKVSDEEMQELSNLLTAMNNIIIPKIKELEKEDKEEK